MGTGTGSQSDFDPRELAIADDLSKLAADPYNTAAQQTSEEKSKRRSLDDMRRLSETIKSAPSRTPHKKTSAPHQRLAPLRGQLECALIEVKSIYREAQDCMDQKAAEMLIEQLRDAAEHIECALDELMPLEK